MNCKARDHQVDKCPRSSPAFVPHCLLPKGSQPLFWLLMLWSGFASFWILCKWNQALLIPLWMASFTQHVGEIHLWCMCSSSPPVFIAVYLLLECTTIYSYILLLVGIEVCIQWLAIMTDSVANILVNICCYTWARIWDCMCLEVNCWIVGFTCFNLVNTPKPFSRVVEPIFTPVFSLWQSWWFHIFIWFLLWILLQDIATFLVIFKVFCCCC